MRRVVVTGIGAVTPLGNSFMSSWEAVKAGLSGIAPITRFDASEIRWKVSGELKRFDAGKYLTSKEISRLDPFVHYALSASSMAGEDAGLIQSAEGLKNISGLSAAGIIIGSSRGGVSTIEKSLNRSNSSNRFRLSPYLMPSTSVNAAASCIAQKMGIKGHCLGISNACASGANAIGEAYRLIKSGYTDMVFAGGAEAPICRLCVEGYGRTGALSKIGDFSASRPLDITRDGFVLSEGACILVLEEYKAALKRNAEIYGEIIGYGNTTDAFHQTRPDPSGEARAIRNALDEAGILSDEIDYISAHATSTPLGDKAETDAIKLVFGKRAYEIPASAVKSMTGHMLSASGSFEAAAALMSAKEGIIPPAKNLERKDPECGLNCAAEARRAEIRSAVSNSFGFGGVNAVLVFRKV